MNAATKQDTMTKPEMLNEGRGSAWSVWLRATRILEEKEGENGLGMRRDVGMGERTWGWGDGGEDACRGE